MRKEFTAEEMKELEKIVKFSVTLNENYKRLSALDKIREERFMIHQMMQRALDLFSFN